MPITRRLAFGLAAAGLAAPAVLRAQPRATNRTIADTLAADVTFQSLLEFVQRAGGMDMLRSNGPITLFAPTNAAFSRAPANIIADLIGGTTQQQSEVDPVRARAVVQTHIVGKLLTTGSLRGIQQQVSNANDGVLIIDGRGNPITLQLANRVGGAGAGTGAGGINGQLDIKIIGEEVIAANGVIFPIDTLILP